MSLLCAPACHPLQVITLDTAGANYRSVWAMHKHFPHVKTFVRAFDIENGAPGVGGQGTLVRGAPREGWAAKGGCQLAVAPALSQQGAALLAIQGGSRPVLVLVAWNVPHQTRPFLSQASCLRGQAPPLWCPRFWSPRCSWRPRFSAR